MGTVQTSKYVRKPFYVDAVQVTTENFKEVLEWCQGDLKVVDEPPSVILDVEEELKNLDSSKHYIRIRVNNPKGQRQTRAFVGDWILYSDRGYKIYPDKTFKDNFDEVGGGPLEEPDRSAEASVTT